MLSFCITCKGRLHHLKHTLPVNIGVVEDCFPGCDIVLLDYDSPDGLEEWVAKHMQKYLHLGVLKYYRSVKPQKYFCRCHAKNVVHRLAQGEYLCNLDADNFLSYELMDETLSLINDRQRFIAYGKGSCQGRITVHRDDFFGVGGYDEDFYGWGMEDKDFIVRVVASFQPKIVDLSHYDLALEHSDLERMKYSETNDLSLSWQDNVALYHRNVANRQYVANICKKRWGQLFVRRLKG